MRLPELFDFVFTLPGLAWSHVNLTLSGSFMERISEKLLEAGREVDRRLEAGIEDVPRQQPKRDYGVMQRADEFDGFAHWPEPGTPEVMADYLGMAVVLKPRGWEVDGKGSATNDCALLSQFMQSRYPKDCFPLLYLSEFDHGFIHRLDIPSSGLILTGTSFEGLYWIRWQLNVYYIAREYYVMCQGSASSDLQHIHLAIDVRTHKLGSHRSITCDHGGPAETWLCVASHLQTPFCKDAVTPVCIRIRTGRKHQIRTHLRSSGHPSVVDGMYGVLSLDIRPH